MQTTQLSLKYTLAQNKTGKNDEGHKQCEIRINRKYVTYDEYNVTSDMSHVQESPYPR